MNMATEWHWFVIIVTFASLAFFLWLLLVNRKTDGGDHGEHEWDGIRELDNPLPAWWVWMFVISIVFTIIYLAIFPGLGNFAGVTDWSSQDEHDAAVVAHNERFAPLYDRLAALTPEALSEDQAALQVGRRIYLNNCATCHGVTAEGAPGFPNLADDHWIWGGDFTAIEHSITRGRQAAMPPWGPALGNEGVTNVANYVMRLAGRDHDEQRADLGAEGFAVFCVSCHGAEGKGNVLLGAPDITAGEWIYGTDLSAVAETIRNGRNGQMPAFEDFLDAERRKILAAYILSLSK